MFDRNEARRRWASVVMSSDDDGETVVRPDLQASCDAWGNVWDDHDDDPFLALPSVLPDYSAG